MVDCRVSPDLPAVVFGILDETIDSGVKDLVQAATPDAERGRDLPGPEARLTLEQLDHGFEVDVVMWIGGVGHLSSF